MTVDLDTVAKIHSLDCKEISVNGSIETLDDYVPASNFFTLHSDTSWAPTTELWEAVVAQYKGVSFVYFAEECGESIYVNTDITRIYFPERYLLEICGDAPVPEGWYPNQDKPDYFDIRKYFDSFEELNSYCVTLTGNDFDTFEELQTYISGLFDSEENMVSNVIEFTEE